MHIFDSNTNNDGLSTLNWIFGYYLELAKSGFKLCRTRLFFNVLPNFWHILCLFQVLQHLRYAHKNQIYFWKLARNDEKPCHKSIFSLTWNPILLLPIPSLSTTRKWHTIVFLSFFLTFCFDFNSQFFQNLFLSQFFGQTFVPKFSTTPKKKPIQQIHPLHCFFRRTLQNLWRLFFFQQQWLIAPKAIKSCYKKVSMRLWSS